MVSHLVVYWTVATAEASRRRGGMFTHAEERPRCGTRMQWVAARTGPDSIRTYLTGVGLPAEPPAIAPPGPPPQHELDFGC